MTTLLSARPAGAATAAVDDVVEVTVDAPPAWVRRAGGRPARWRMHARAGGMRAGAVRRPPVVLVHGLVVASGLVAPLAERLATDGPVFAPDLPGCGRSDKPEPVPDIGELGDALAAWCRAVVGEPAVLVGVSIGSQVVVSAATRAPGTAAAVVLVGPTVDDRRRSWWAQLPRWQAEQATQSWRTRVLQARDYARAGVPRALRTFRAAMDHRPEDDVVHLTVPALVCWGSRDPLVRREWAQHLADLAPNGRLAVLPGVVHAATAENPVETARVLNGFLDDVPGLLEHRVQAGDGSDDRRREAVPT
ncbi:alpha/beta fold hydrolase [Trujillonella humicola]|uniref:alpha/beta fold hydrolase n=1 Tax=Trujillonella humicola TaxID=3383699 RepID=UPI003906AEB6